LETTNWKQQHSHWRLYNISSSVVFSRLYIEIRRLQIINNITNSFSTYMLQYILISILHSTSVIASKKNFFVENVRFRISPAKMVESEIVNWENFFLWFCAVISRPNNSLKKGSWKGNIIQKIQNSYSKSQIESIEQKNTGTI